MNKRLLLTLALFGIIQAESFSQNIFSDEPVQVVGSFNGYNTASTSNTTYRKVSTTVNNPTDGRGQWAKTVNAQPVGGDVTNTNMPGGPSNGFLFISGPASNRFQNKWVFAAVAQATVDQVNDITNFNNGNDMGLNASTSGYYTFAFSDVGYTATNAKYYIGYTTNAPVNVTWNNSTVDPVFGTVNVSINTSATPSAQERIFVRYTTGTDFTSSSQVVEATGSGTSYNAVIPFIPGTNGQVVRYFIFTSTRPASFFNTTGGAADETLKTLSTLRYDDQNGLNFIASIPLDLQINEFNVTQQNSNTNKVDWKVACGLGNGVDFDVMRSIDGINYTSVYNETATRARCAMPFSFTDRYLAKSPITYYKLKILHPITGLKYSSVVTINNNNNVTKALSLFPNLITTDANIVIKATAPTNAQFMVLDKAGKKVSVFNKSINEGYNALGHDFSNLPAGSYYLSVVLDGQLETIAFIKQ
jgi:hypothetical protein